MAAGGTGSSPLRSLCEDEESGMHPSIEHVLKFFEYSHLPHRLAVVSKDFYDLAHKVAKSGDNPEVTVSLRKLLEAKDAAVRSLL
jgi:hypothetical protein